MRLLVAVVLKHIEGSPRPLAGGSSVFKGYSPDAAGMIRIQRLQVAGPDALRLDPPRAPVPVSHRGRFP